MTTFLDGPAKGRSLSLQRAPVFLRVVREGEKWDALDQLEDSPAEKEDIFAYAIQGEPGVVHTDFRGPDGRREAVWRTIATYRFSTRQPTDAVMRDTKLWREWCQNQSLS